MDTTNNQINEEVPKVEEFSNEELVEQPLTEEEEENNGQQFSLLIKTPVEIGTIQIQVTVNDTVFDIQTFLNETTETCLYSSYALHFKGEKLNEFSELSSIPELADGSVLEMLPVEYNERTARLHVKRLRDILNTGLQSDSTQTHPSLFSSLSYPEKSKLQSDENENGEQDETSTTEKKEKVEKKKKVNNNNNSKKPKKVNKVQDEQKLEEETRKEDITVLKKYEKPILANYFTKTTTNTTIQCVRSLNNSGWSPVPGYRKLQGDLFYLDITLIEGNTIFVTSNSKGFYVNQSTASTFNPIPSPNKQFHSHCLHTVLTAVSKSFKSGLHKVLNQLSQRHPYEMLPGSVPLTQWIGRPKIHPSFDMNRSNDSVLIPTDIEFRGQPRDWNEELQGIRELPKESYQERILRDRAFAKVHSEFVDTAIKGAQAIISKSLLPINPLDNEKSHMFLYQNIFFSFPLDTRDMFIECGGDNAARASANNDLKGIRLYNLAEIDGLHTVGTCIIDYRGHRITAQTLVPGILSNEATSTVLYGSMDGKNIKFDEVFHDKLNKAGSMLHLAERKVYTEETPEPVTLCTASDSKGIIGIDGRHYVLDLVRATPRDPNYPELKDQMCILRPELIATYAEYVKETWISNKVKEIREKKLKEKKENTTETTETTTTTTTTTTTEGENNTKPEDDVTVNEEDLKNLNEKPPVVEFNPNLYTNVKISSTEEELKKDIDSLKAVGVFLKNVIIPKLIEDIIVFNITPIDGQNLTALMHNRGINMRYLGLIATNESVSKVPFIQDICFGEMVSRSTKHIFNNVISQADPSELSIVTAHFLNCFLGTATGTVSSEEMTKRYKSIQSSSVHTLNQVNLWEQISQTIKEKYDFEITTHSVPMESRLIVLRSLCLKVGLQIQVRDYDFTTDFTFNSDDTLDLQCVVKHLNPRSSDGLDLLEHGRLYFSQRRFDLAQELLTESLSILHQVHGPIYPDIATCYQHLALVALYNDKIDAAIDHQKNCLIVTEKVFGLDHNETIHAYSNLAAYCQRAGRLNEAMGYYKHALYLMDLLGGECNPERAHMYSSIASLLQDQGSMELAIEFYKLALKHQEGLVGPLHPISAATHHAIAYAYATMHKFTESIEYERKAYKILEKELGPDHFRTKESFTFIQQLTSTAVQIQKMKIAQYQQQQQKQQIKQTNKQLHQKLANPTPTTTLKKEELDRLQQGPVTDILKYINNSVRTSSIPNGRPKITIVQKSKPQETVDEPIVVEKPVSTPVNSNKKQTTSTTTTTTTTTASNNNNKNIKQGNKPTSPNTSAINTNTNNTNNATANNNKSKPVKK